MAVRPPSDMASRSNALMSLPKSSGASRSARAVEPTRSKPTARSDVASLPDV